MIDKTCGQIRIILEQKCKLDLEKDMQQLIILHALIKKYHAKKRKVYVAFIDYRKAFDSVDRSKMWEILQKHGINGNMLRTIKSISTSVLSNVKCNNDNIDYFSCPNGLKQGCIMSPLLFSYLVITNGIRRRGGNGIQLFPGAPEIAILLFADDIILIADTVTELQKKYATGNCIEAGAYCKYGKIKSYCVSTRRSFSGTQKIVYRK